MVTVGHTKKFVKIFLGGLLAFLIQVILYSIRRTELYLSVSSQIEKVIPSCIAKRVC